MAGAAGECLSDEGWPGGDGEWANFRGTSDKMVRALDENSGEVVWETQVNAPIGGIPAVYEVGGKEYIVFCSAEAYVAFAIP